MTKLRVLEQWVKLMLRRRRAGTNGEPTGGELKYKPETFLGCQTVEPKIKTKTYEIGENRVLKYNRKKEVITICDKKTGKEAVFTPARWASFRLYMDEVDAQLNNLSQDRDVAYCTHYGGG